jgi:hypothetical protein
MSKLKQFLIWILVVVLLAIAFSAIAYTDISILFQLSWNELLIGFILAPAPLYLPLLWICWPDIQKRFKRQETWVGI